MSKYKYAFFDMDGTLSNSREGIFKCTEYAFEKLGVPIDNSYESLRRVIGPPLVWAYHTYFGLSEEDARRATDLYRERYSRVGLFEMELYDGVKEALQTLSDKGIKMAVVSAKPQEYIERIIPHFGLDKFFEFTSCASKKDTDTSKSHLIQRAIDYFDIKDLTAAVMVGDTKYDLDSAAEIGIDGIGVSYGFGDREEIENCANVFIAEKITDAAKFIIGKTSDN